MTNSPVGGGEREAELPYAGCGDSSCEIERPRPGSMCTNGGCRCLRDMQRDDFAKWRRVIGRLRHLNKCEHELQARAASDSRTLTEELVKAVRNYLSAFDDDRLDDRNSHREAMRRALATLQPVPAQGECICPKCGLRHGASVIGDF